MPRIDSNEWPQFRTHTTPPFLDPGNSTTSDEFTGKQEVIVCKDDTLAGIVGRTSGDELQNYSGDKLTLTDITPAGTWTSIIGSDLGERSQQITGRHDRNAGSWGLQGVNTPADYPSDYGNQTVHGTGIKHGMQPGYYVNVDSSSHLMIGNKADGRAEEISLCKMDTSTGYNSSNNRRDYVDNSRQNGLDEDEEDYFDSDRDDDINLVHLLRRRAQQEQEITSILQPPSSMDSSMYVTYSDLSSIFGGELSEEDHDTIFAGNLSTSSEELNANNSSSASSYGVVHKVRATNLNTRLAKSTESIPTQVDCERQRAEENSEPLQRSRSLENLNLLRVSSSGAPSCDEFSSTRPAVVNNSNYASCIENINARSPARSACAKRRLITAKENVCESVDITRGVRTDQGDGDTPVERSFADEVRLCALPVYIPPASDRMYHQHQRVPSPLMEMDEDEDEDEASQGGVEEKHKEVTGAAEDKAPPKPRRGEERSLLSEEESTNEMVKRVSSPRGAEIAAESDETVEDEPHDVKDKHRTGDESIESKMAAPNINVPQIIETLVEDDEDNEGERIVLQLQSRLAAVEKLAQDLSDQNAKLQEELKEMQLEVEESQDKYREGGDIEEYRDMKMELDRAVRDCRIMQYRLRKAERKNEEFEQDRVQWEDRLRASSAGIPTPLLSGSAVSSGDSSPEDTRCSEIAELHQELRTAKDVSIRLHQELEMIEEKRAKTEEECQNLRRKLVDSENTKKEMRRDLEKTRTELHRTEVDVIRRKLKQSHDADASKKLKAKIQVLRASSTSSDSDSEVEYDVSSLLNDLEESTERERDLQNQMQLLEEEANAIRKSLSRVEQEKEALDFELERFKMRFGTLEEGMKSESVRGASTEKEAELRLQLMLVEQEATVMRRKMRELEMKNEEMTGVLDRPTAASSSTGTEKGTSSSKSKDVDTEPDASRPTEENISAEVSALKRQLEGVLRENEALRVKLETFEELNTLYPTSDTKESPEGQDDARPRHMQTDTVVASLKLRLVEAEFENRSLQLETESLRKLSEIAGAKDHGKGKVKGTEHKLRSQIALLKTEADSMRRKMISLEDLNDRLEEATEKTLAEKVAIEKVLVEKERKSEPVSRQESTSSTTSEVDNERLHVLQSQITTLQDELGDLILVVKSKEVTQEQQEKELFQTRQEAEQLRSEASKLQQDLQLRLTNVTKERNLLLQRIRILEERSEGLQTDLKRACSVSREDEDEVQRAEGEVQRSEVAEATDDVFVEQEATPEVAVNFERCLKDRIATLETQLAEERQKCKVAEKRAEMLNGGASGMDDEGGLQVSQSEDAAYKEREKELLRFELTECHLAIDDLTSELARERELFAHEKSEMDLRLQEYAKKFHSPDPVSHSPDAPQTQDEQDRADKRFAFEKESTELQKKMETMAWRREKAELSKRLDELKMKMEDMQSRPDVTASASLGQEEKKSDSSRPDTEKEELKKILGKLETEVEILDGECWKYRELAEDMQSKMKVMTAQSEELKASSDILTQERSLLHSKVASIHQDRTELDIRLKKEREAWAREKSELIARQDEQQQENARKLSDIQHEFGQFQLEKQTLQQRTVELETYMKSLKTNGKEGEERLKETQSHLETIKASHEAEMAKLRRGYEHQIGITSSEGRVELEEMDLDLRSKSRQLEEISAKVELMEQELEQSRGTIHALDAQLRAQEDCRSKEKAELIKSARNGEDELRSENTRLGKEMRDLQAKLSNREKDWKAERNELQEALEKLKSSLKARDASWESDRSKLVLEVKSLQSNLMTREDSWKVERGQSNNIISELRGKVHETEMKAKKREEELMSRVEAATELVETHKVSEAKFKDERRRLIKQIEDKVSDIKNVSKESDRLQRLLDNQSRRVDNARFDVQIQFQRDEKIWKAEIAASRFKLEAETKYFKEELARLQSKLESEVKGRSDMERDLQVAVKEEHEQKAIAERAVAEKMLARQAAEKESLSAKRSKQLMEELQRDRRSLSAQLTAEKERCEALQRSYGNEKASWDVKRNELITKVGRLEQQTKLKKVKLEDLQVRLQAAWDIERADNRRLVAEANQNSLETRRQMDSRESKWQREFSATQEKFTKERKDWEEDKRKLSDAIKELEDQMQSMKDMQKRSSQVECHYQRDKELWRSERADLQKRLQGSLTSRRLEHNRIETMIQELQKLKMMDTTPHQNSENNKPVTSKSHSSSFEAPTKGFQELTIIETKQTSEKSAPPRKEKGDLVRRMQEKVPEHDGNDGIAHEQEVPDVIKASDSMTVKNAFEEVATSEKDYRSKSHSDVARAVSVVRQSKPVCQRAMQYESSTPSSTETTSIQVITTERQPLDGNGKPLREGRSYTRSAEILTSSSPKPRRKRSPEKQVRAQTPEPTSSTRVQVLPRMCSTPTPSETTSRTVSSSVKDSDSEYGSSCNSNTNSASSSPSLTEKNTGPGKVTTKPVLTRFGRFDAQGMLRETDRKSSPQSSDSELKIETDIEKRMAEMERSRVRSTKKMFEQNLARGAGTLPSRSLSPRREHDDTSDHECDVEQRHTDSELYTRVKSPTSEKDISILSSREKDSAPSTIVVLKGVGASAPCGLDSQSAKNTSTSKPSGHAHSTQQLTQSASNSSGNSKSHPTVKPAVSSPAVQASSPGGSPKLHRSNYPCAPPGFLLPKKINEVQSSSKRTEGTPLVGETPSSPTPTWRHSSAPSKNFNIPLPPYQTTTSQTGEPMSVIPGQLPRTKSQMQAKSRTSSEVPKYIASTGDVESPGSRRKRISPRSARANFFADLPPSLMLLQQQQLNKPSSTERSREPNNNNNNPHRPSQLNVTSETNKNETLGGASTSQSSPRDHSPSGRSSIWTAAPTVSHQQHHSKIKTEEHSSTKIETQVLSSKRPSAAVSPTRRVPTQSGSPKLSKSKAPKHPKKRAKSSDRAQTATPRCVTFASPTSPSGPLIPLKPNTTRVTVVSSKKTVNTVETCRVLNSSSSEKGVSDSEKSKGSTASSEVPLKPAPTVTFDEMQPRHVVPALTPQFARPAPSSNRRRPARWLTSKRLKTSTGSLDSLYRSERRPSGSSMSDYETFMEQELFTGDGHCKRKRPKVETTV
ncbi:uncharacterized protein [Asterias amurensis]|uniref:uncharacterized protein isoform X4 n=1 Tax=Asterias amurensis TaxID=7602 RepID=UPI003AB52CD6